MKLKDKKILKIGGPIFGVGIFTTVIVSLSGVFVKIPTVSIGGSTAVLPLINAFSDKYNGVDIVTSAGGSGVGINSVVDKTKLIGMASKNPEILKLDKNDKKYINWKNYNVKTLTIAWDGIGIVYKPTSKSQENNIVINEENLAKLYTSFSGVRKLTFDDFLKNGDKTEITPYARNGGATISGTADGFLKDSHLNYKESNYWKSLSKQEQENVLSNLEEGSYESNVIQTAEANSRAWSRVKNGAPGSMVYLSTGFILNNKEEIEKEGFKIAMYKEFQLTHESVSKGYDWYRPFNLMYSIDTIEKNKAVVEMLKWMIFSNEANEIIKNEGYVNLDENQLKSMGYDGNDKYFFINKNFSDFNLGFCGAGEVK